MKRFTLYLLIYILLPFLVEAQVLNENFDASSNIPENWQKIVQTTSSYYDITLNGYTSNSKPNSIKYYGGSNADDVYMLVSPQVDLTTSSSYKVSLYMYGGIGNKLEVGTISDPADLSTYSAYGTLELTESYQFEYLELFISPNELTHLAFKRISGTIYIDDILVEPVLPYNVKLEKIEGLEAVVSNSASQFKFLVKNSGANDATYNLSVQYDLQYQILDKSGENEISSIQVNALTNDTIMINITASEITENQLNESFTLKAEAVEDPDIGFSLGVDFVTYLPFVEIEEGFEINALPFAWQINSPEKVKIYKSAYNAYSGECYVQMNKGTAEDPSLLITPVIKGYNGNYKISAWLEGSDPVEIGKITDLNDWSTYQTIGEVTGGSYDYEQINIQGIRIENDAYIVFKFIGASSYAKALIDDIDIEKDQEYAVDLKSEYTEKNLYVGKTATFPLYVVNKGLKDETYNITVDCDWNYKVLDSGLETEIASQFIETGATDTVYIQITAPSEGIMNGTEVMANVKVECSNNVDNFEKIDLTNRAYFYSTYLNEGFERISKLPVNWVGYEDGSSTVGLSDYNYYEGEQCIKIYQSSYATRASYFATPLFKSSESDYTVSFWAKVSNGPENFELGTLRQPNDFETYENIDTITLTSEYQKFTINDVLLSEARAFTFVSDAGGKTVYLDSIVISQENTTVEFYPVQDAEIEDLRPGMFVYFSHPVVKKDNTELLAADIDNIVELRQGSQDGTLISFDAVVAEDKQTIKITPASNLQADAYYLILKEELNDINGNLIHTAQISFNILDKIAPEFVEGYPVVENIMESTLDVRLQTNEAGKAYYIVVNKGAAVPTSDQVKAAADYGDVTIFSANNDATEIATDLIFNVENLDAQVSYDIYVVAEDIYGNLQESPVQLNATTVDLTAPVFVENYPLIDGIEEDGFNLRLKATEEGTSYYVVVPENSVLPTAEEVKAGIDYNSIQVVNSGSIETNETAESVEFISGLDSNSEYFVYVTIEDVFGNLQETISELNITTKISTSINDLMLSVNITPNPATDYIKISTVENIDTYKLLNSIGNLVLMGHGKGNTSTVNVSSLRSGIYFVVVKIITGEEIVKRIVIK